MPPVAESSSGHMSWRIHWCPLTIRDKRQKKRTRNEEEEEGGLKGGGRDGVRWER